MSLVKPKKGIGYEVRWMRQGKRQTIYLKGAKRSVAEKFDRKMKELLDCERHGVHLPGSLVGWLQSLDKPIHDRLVELGLAEERVEKRPIPRLLEAQQAYLDAHTQAESTKEQLEICFRLFSEFLKVRRKPNPLVTKVTKEDARAFRTYRKKRKIAESTVRKNCSRNSQLFVQLLEDEIVDHNPFATVKKSAVTTAAKKLQFVEQKAVLSLIDEVEIPELKIVLALCRFGGLRRHECALLRWRDIDFEAGKMTVRSNKTPPIRTTPLFKILKPILEEYKRDDHKKVQAKWDCDSNGPDSALRFFCKKKKLAIWPRPFQNLRASRETELLDRYSVADVCSWIGNSPQVAMKHYAMARNENFQHAINANELEEKKNG
tara:strand:- start:132 stop:1256 length:1125 start_codon:yes stop_codon:yes gene_type:complete